MVTYLQVARGVGRGLRAMERDAARAERQRLSYAKALAKQEMLESASDAAEQYRDLLERLTGVHRIEFARRDWSADASAEPPPEPQRSDCLEQNAARALSNYRPGWFARTFGFAEKTREKLLIAVRRAALQDEADHHAAVEKVRARCEEIAFARQVIAGDRDCTSSALRAHAEFSCVAIESLSVLYCDDRVIAMVDGLEIDDMPTRSVTLLQSGKASIKPLPQSKVMELHRDNLCSAAVRVAAEFLKALPRDAVEVVVNTDLLDPGTGHITAQPVLYARIAAQALSSVNLPLTDPSVVAERLGAHFVWSKKAGFKPIDLDACGVPTDVVIDAPS